MRHVTPHIRISGDMPGGSVQLIVKAHDGYEIMRQLQPPEVTALVLALIAEQRAGFMLSRYDALNPELLTLSDEAARLVEVVNYEVTELQSAIRTMLAAAPKAAR